MAAFWMCNMAPTEIAGSDAFNRSQTSGQRALAHYNRSTAGPTGAGKRDLRVLVVDDEQDTTDGLVRLVRRWGHKARMAYDGLNALRVAADQRPDVVLLDIAMPLMDGYQVARQLRLDFPGGDMFIVAVTGWGDSLCRQNREESGIDLVLIKPVDSDLVETLLMLEYQRVNRLAADVGAFGANGPLPGRGADLSKHGGSAGRTTLLA
jgi:CheY-like chemotaxis protein